MIMKHPRIRYQKVITDILRDKLDNSFFFVQRHADCRVSTGFGDIPRDIPPNAKSGDGPKISPVNKTKTDQPEKFRVW